jgi:hypothetical protein
MGDPNITDTCLYFDLVPPSQYWLSPKLIMATTADQGFVETGVDNTTNLTSTWKADCGLQEGAHVVLDLFISNVDPSLPMTTLTEGGTLNTIVSGELVTQTMGTTVTTPFLWNPNNFNTPHPIGTGHRCLLARIYPTNDIPTDGDLTTFPSNDQHYAMHNCHVGATDSGQIKVPIKNGNWRAEPLLVAIQAIPDLQPNRTVLDAVLPGLQLIPAFKQIATAPLRRVELDLSPFTSPHESLLDKIEDWIEKEVIDIIEDLETKCRQAGGTSVRVALPPNFFAPFNFVADLSGSNPGDAHIYHVSQVNGAGEPYGGLTVAIVRT